MTRAELLVIAKPILFNTEMTRAVMDGRKTQTRRVIKPQPSRDREGMWHWKDCQWTDGGIGFPASGIDDYAPYKAGDYLYVRETWGCYTHDWQDALYFVYKSDYPDGAEGYWFEPEHINWCDLPKWRPSIHMPKAAARTFLQVTGVKAERLRDLCKDWSNFDNEGIIAEHGFRSEMHQQFEHLWNSTIKKSDLHLYRWDASPWVWVYEFKKVEAEP